MTVALRQRPGPDLDAATLYRLLRLRVEVFVVEQACPYPELDSRDLDPSTTHYWLEQPGGPAGEVVSTLRLIEERVAGRSVFRIGRVCTRAADRGRGHTTRLMRAALADIGSSPCRLNAQSHLAGMYARHGFAADGPEFDEDGIGHLPMLRPGR